MARKHLNIGGKIQARRKAMGLSQEDLAQLTGVSRQSVTKWETGQSAPDLDRLVEVSDVLGVSLDFLLREPQQVSSPPSFAVADSPPFAEDGSPGASGVPKGIDSSLNGMAPAVAVERVASCGQVPVAPFGRETDGLLGITKRSSAPLSGFRNVPPACRKRSLLNPPLPVSRRPLYALPVPMIPDFMVPIFGLSCAVPPRYAVSCCS